MKLKIEPPNWYDLFFPESLAKTSKALSEWFDTHVEPINKLLADGFEVYTGASGIWATHKENAGLTHRALLITIEPIRKESAEDVLRDLIKCKDGPIDELWDVVDRARKVLGES